MKYIQEKFPQHKIMLLPKACYGSELYDIDSVVEDQGQIKITLNIGLLSAHKNSSEILKHYSQDLIQQDKQLESLLTFINMLHRQILYPDTSGFFSFKMDSLYFHEADFENASLSHMEHLLKLKFYYAGTQVLFTYQKHQTGVILGKTLLGERVAHTVEKKTICGDIAFHINQMVDEQLIASYLRTLRQFLCDYALQYYLKFSSIKVHFYGDYIPCQFQDRLGATYLLARKITKILYLENLAQ